MKAKPPIARRSTARRTELLRVSRQAARRLAREAADRERRVYITAKFDRTWSALTRLRTKVGAARFRDLMVDLPDALDEIGTPALGAVAEFHDLLGGDGFHDFLAEVADALETGSNPGGLSAKWIEVLCGRTPLPASNN